MSINSVTLDHICKNSTTQKRESLAVKANKKGEEGGLKKTETVGQNHSAERTQGFSVGTVSNRQVSKKNPDYFKN